jgi:hypothetical protein
MKFQTADNRYLEARRELSAKYGERELWSVIDQWPLYAGIGNLSRFLAIAELVKESLSVPGHIAEFGSWKGGNLIFMAKLLRIFDPHGPKVVHGFDSFEGLTEFAAQDDLERTAGGQYAGLFQGGYKGAYSELQEIIRLYEMQDDVNIHKGIIEETLPALLERNQELAFSLVYCDTDLYQSTRLILELMHPRLMKGGLFVFDEWNDDIFPGEGVAANEFMQRFGDCYEVRSVPHCRQPNLVLKKIRM